jgi:hypothetical protein
MATVQERHVDAMSVLFDGRRKALVPTHRRAEPRGMSHHWPELDGGRDMRRRRIVISSLLALLLVGAGGVAEAAAVDGRPLVGRASDPATPDSQVGRLRLFSRGAVVTSLTYVGCPGTGRIHAVSGTVDSFGNVPADGCEVVLRNKAGGTFELCIGSGSIPAAFQQSPLVRIQPGTSFRCV